MERGKVNAEESPELKPDIYGCGVSFDSGRSLATECRVFVGLLVVVTGRRVSIVVVLLNNDNDVLISILVVDFGTVFTNVTENFISETYPSGAANTTSSPQVKTNL